MAAPKLTESFKNLFLGSEPEVSDDPYQEVHGDASLLCRNDLEIR